MKFILFVCMTLAFIFKGTAQSDISMFQLIQKPIAEVSLDSISDLDTIYELLGDSVDVSAICVLQDTLDIHSIHLNIGNETGYNLIQDSLLYSNLPSTVDDPIYRSANVLYIECGRFLKTDTLYGEAYSKNVLGVSGTIKYYE